MPAAERPARTTPQSLSRSLSDAAAALDALRKDRALIDAAGAAAERLAAALVAGGKVLICGNGGSLCDAAHFAEELTGRFRADRRPLAALACADAAHITCTANDYGFDHVFSRWVQALGRPGDCVILLSTSGNSANILLAAHAARAAGATTIALLGRGGGSLRGVCDVELIVPGDTSDRIQELHMLLLHWFVEAIEQELGLSPAPRK
ncbi:MAG: SIS domain-containing protein [Leptolyngbya sp. PLA1]|nr:SIS domain-containing protein [Leptolyngbya sp. PLA1]